MQRMQFFSRASETRKGELIILVETFLWSLFPVVTLLSFGQLNPLGAAAWSTLLATIFFAVWLTFSRRWHELRNLHAYKSVLLATLFIGVGYYTLYFSGLRFVTAGSAAIISQMEVWFSFLFFGVILRSERYTTAALLGAGLMFVGVLIVLSRDTFVFSLGNFLILSATLVTPIGNHFQKQARAQISAATLLFIRCALSTPFMFGLAMFSGALPKVSELAVAWPFLFVNGLLLLGFSKILWVEGTYRLPIAKAASLNMLAPLLTLLFAYFFLHEIPTRWQLFGLIPMLAGGLLILRHSFLRESELI